MRPAQGRPSRPYRPNGLLDKAKTGLLRPNSRRMMMMMMIKMIALT